MATEAKGQTAGLDALRPIIAEMKRLSRMVALDSDSSGPEVVSKAETVWRAMSYWWTENRSIALSREPAEAIELRLAVETALQTCREVVDGKLPRGNRIDEIAGSLESLLLLTPSGETNEETGDSGEVVVDNGDDSRGVSYDEEAAAIKAIHPDWTDKQIAMEVGCHVQTLYKPNMLNYKRVKKALKEAREEYRDDLGSDRRIVSGPDRRHRRSTINKRSRDDE